MMVSLSINFVVNSAVFSLSTEVADPDIFFVIKRKYIKF
jgi:hypothetical protein